MTIVTLCGNIMNDADCGYCLRMAECKEARDAICHGCMREAMCPRLFKQDRAEEGFCRGREMKV